jgi:hypothetical protein
MVVVGVEGGGVERSSLWGGVGPGVGVGVGVMVVGGEGAGVGGVVLGGTCESFSVWQR